MSPDEEAFLDPEWFEVEFRCWDTDSALETRTIGPDRKELEEILQPLQAVEQLAMGVSAFDQDDCDVASFWLFLNGDRAWIHLIDGPCWTAVEPDAGESSQKTIRFRDDAGHWHCIPLEGTITREQGWEVLLHWFPETKRWSRLRWKHA